MLRLGCLPRYVMGWALWNVPITIPPRNSTDEDVRRAKRILVAARFELATFAAFYPLYNRNSTFAAESRAAEQCKSDVINHYTKRLACR